MTINILYNILRGKTFIAYKYKNKDKEQFILKNDDYNDVSFDINEEEKRYKILITKYKDLIIEYYIFSDSIPKWDTIKINENVYPEPIIVYESNTLKKDDIKNKKNINLNNIFEKKHITIDFFKMWPVTEIKVLDEEEAKDIQKVYYDSYNDKSIPYSEDVFYKLFYHPIYMKKIYGYEHKVKNPIASEIKYFFVKQ